MSLTPEQIAIRRTGIGASEAAAVLGKSPYAQPIDVFAAKRDGAVVAESAPMEWGNLLEPIILDKYQSLNSAPLIRQPTIGTLRGRPHVLATPDACVDGQPVLVQAKNFRERRRSDFGPEGTDEIPDDILIQVTVELGCARTDDRSPMQAPPEFDDVAVLFGAHEFGVWRVKFNADLWGAIADKLEKFWRDHLETGRPPPVDGSEAYTAWLQQHYAVRTGNKECRGATREEEGWMQRYRQLRDQAKGLEDEAALYGNRLRDAIGADYGVSSYGIGKMLLTGGAESERTDWEALATDLLSLGHTKEDREGWIRKHTTKHVTARQLRPYWSKS